MISSAAVIILSIAILGTTNGRLHTTTVKALASQPRPSVPANAGHKIAALVGDRVIPIAQVSEIALRLQGANILEQLIGDRLIDQEAKRRNMTATPDEIYTRTETIRQMMQPKSLDDSLKARHMSMDDFRSEMRSGIEVRKLLIEQLKPVKMVHVRDIFVNISPFAGMADNLHTAAQADTIMATVARKLKAGASFDELAKQYGDGNIDGNGGDLGIVTNFPDADQNSIARGFSGQPAFLKACLSLKNGQVTGPVRTRFGLHMIQAISTGDDPLPSEESAYATVKDQAAEDQLTRLAPPFVDSLRHNGKVSVSLGTRESASSGIAAVVNGEVIPMSQVVDIALSSVGPMVTEGLIGNAVVDAEAQKRHITVTPSQVDAKLAELRQQAKPRTLDDVLRQGHMTMAELREAQKVKIETEEMISQSIGNFRAAHLRVIGIQVKTDPQIKVGHPMAEAQLMLGRILAKLKSGENFEDIAKQYSEDPGSKARNGDIGIVTEKGFYEPSFLKAALALKKGQFTASPVRTPSELCLIQAESTSGNHPSTENALYNQAQQDAKEREIQRQVPNFIRKLRSQYKVVNYLTSA